MVAGGRFDITIKGRKYIADLSQYQRQSADAVRQQADTSREFGESSLNPMDLWRRSQVEFHLGAGRRRFDHPRDENRAQFWEGHNLDPWERNRIGPALDISQITSYWGSDPSAESVLDMMFVAFGQELHEVGAGQYTWDGTAQNIQDLASDGRNLYILADDGIYWLDAKNDGSIPDGPHNDTTGDIIDYVKGRLLVGRNEKLFDVQNLADHGDASEPEPDPITLGMDLPSTSSWVALGETPDGIVAANENGDKTLIYRIVVREGDTNLAVPTPAVEMPRGESVKALSGYVGSVLVGTSEGFRLALWQGGGIQYGPLVDLGAPVHDFTPHREFAYFTVNGDHVGLGRIDLSQFTEDVVPAWSIESTRSKSSGACLHVRLVDGVVHFVYEDTDDNGDSYIGIYKQLDSRMNNYEFKTGEITYDLADDKVHESVMISHEELGANQSITITGETEVESDTITVDEEGSTGGEYRFSGLKGSLCTLTFNVDGYWTEAPKIRRWTLRATPVINRVDQHAVPLVLRDRVRDNQGVLHQFDTKEESAFLRDIQTTGEVIDYQEWGRTYRAIIDGFALQGPLELNRAGDWVQGTLVVQLRTLRDIT